jgi:hypothetical protein
MGPMIAAWLAAAPALGADEGLAWEWSGPRRYLLELDMVAPRPLLFQAERNYEVRVAMMSLKIDTECSVVAPRKSAVDLRCDIKDFSLAAMPLDRDSDHHTVEILDGLEARMKQAWMQISLGYDGKIRTMDLEGMDSKDINERVRGSQEVIRLVFARAFAAFDLALPNKGPVAVGTEWLQTGSETTGFPSMAGSVGPVQLKMSVARTSGSVLTISTKGAGVSGPGETVGSSEALADRYDLVMSGWANFDTAQHAITGRQYEVSGPPTASSVSAQGGSGNPYVQKVRMTLIAPDAPPPQLDANLEMAQP